ncbi:MAG TPA: GntR family transcriptional regulator [Myxococcaceae bacterium]|nr:GntR family transcriptional regulator [Myxococcaceae bacterium]
MERVQRVSVVELALEQIERFMENQRAQGDIGMPSERAMAERLGISRPSVREALFRLRERRALVTVPGRGHFIRDPWVTGSPETALSLLAQARQRGAPQAHALLQELLQFRRTLLQAACALPGVPDAWEKPLGRLEAAALFGRGAEVLSAEAEIAQGAAQACGNIGLALALHASNHVLQAVPGLGEAWKPTAEARAQAYRGLTQPDTAECAQKALNALDAEVLHRLQTPPPRPPEPLLPRLLPCVDTRRHRPPQPPRPPLPTQVDTDADIEQLFAALGPFDSLHRTVERIRAAQRARAAPDPAPHPRDSS